MTRFAQPLRAGRGFGERNPFAEGDRFGEAGCFDERVGHWASL